MVRPHLALAPTLLAMLACLLPASAVAASGPSTVRVSVDSFGRQSSPSPQVRTFPAVSSDGRFVAFQSDAANLVLGDTNGNYDVFVHDRRTRATQRVSVSSTGAEATGSESNAPAISADGRFVAFGSAASNLVADDTNKAADIFVRDRQSGETVRASVSSSGAQTSGGCGVPAISADGRYVAFTCFASDLVAGDTNSVPDVFVRDLRERTTVRASIGQGGVEASGRSEQSVDQRGRALSRSGDATNLVPVDGSGATDVFVRDLQERTTTARASARAAGTNQAPGASRPRSAPAQVRRLRADADNLVSGDLSGERDIFVRDLAAVRPPRASVDAQAATLVTLDGLCGDQRRQPLRGPSSGAIPWDRRSPNP
jgi:hypothetical protein